MAGFGETNKFNKRQLTHLKKKYDENEILNKAINFHHKGNISEANKLYKFLIEQGSRNSTIFTNYGLTLVNFGKLKDAEVFIRKAIKINPKDSIAHYNLGIILKNLGKLDESELSYRKAIEIKPDYVEAHYNLGNLLSNLGKLSESKLSYRKAIELNPNFIKAYYSLSLLKYSDEDKKLKNKLFSQSILNHKSKEDQVNIYFARANILHQEKNYSDSSKFLKLANQLKLDLKPSNSDALIKKSKDLLIESINKEINQDKYTESQDSIFIVGMPRSGSTLLESILGMNTEVYNLGESKILEDSYIDYKKNNQELNLTDIYWKKSKNYEKNTKKTTNKNLYNYLYTGIIASQIANSKIIHCFRHPLDNILSIYRAHFAEGNQYSSSLIDCTKVYLNQEKIMQKYKNKFKSKIYNLNYDLLVCNPKEEIKSLISWLGWKWTDGYLSPHLNPRTVFSASKVQVRSPINSQSIGGWKHYKNLLKPSLEILSETERYRDLLS